MLRNLVEYKFTCYRQSDVPKFLKYLDEQGAMLEVAYRIWNGGFDML